MAIKANDTQPTTPTTAPEPTLLDVYTLAVQLEAKVDFLLGRLASMAELADAGVSGLFICT